MGKRDPRIDAYIARQKDFARPILTYLREVVHEGCPECEETLKWSSPAFVHHGILCGLAAFKERATFGFAAALRTALARNKSAKTAYEGFSPSHKRDYVEWITEARAEETRRRRVAQAVEWMSQGKSRNWKYM